MKHCLLLLLTLCTMSTFANTWRVGATRTYTKPSQVAPLVQAGDTVLIDAGVYLNDVARWTAPGLLLRGEGGKAHLKSGGNVFGGKAIWVIVGNNVTVENIEFSEAACPDLNGAGIRSEGINLVVRHCYFHDNENGILAGDIASGDFLIEYCEFRGNGYANGLAHNLYINHANLLVFRFNYTHDAKTGHEFKSRAYNNFIYCNRFSDENGTASRSIDLPNGGLSFIVGNLIVQDQFSENNNLVGYGLEGLSNPINNLYVTYNTFVNNKNTGSFIQVANNTPKLKAWNNIFAGPGTTIVGTVQQLDTLHNRTASIAACQFTNSTAYDFTLLPGSVALGIATNPGAANGYNLQPTEQYQHPFAHTLRQHGLDAGAMATAVVSHVDQAPTTPLSVFPNPASTLIQLPETIESWQIFDLSGQLMMHGIQKTTIDVAHLDTGLYLLVGRDAGVLRSGWWVKK